MITIDGQWIMEGLNRNDPKCVKSYSQLTDYIDEVGFLPLFKNSVPGFSVEEQTAQDAWWTGSDLDPWSWREIIATEGRIAYGKLFCSRAGFVSREWYPYLAAYRRNGYDFDSRYEDGLASRRAKKIIDVLMKREECLSNELKATAGFGKEGEKGYEGCISQLQMQTYITVRSFRRKKSKKGEEYGWPIASLSLSENLFGEAHVRSQYHLESAKVKEIIIAKIKSFFPEASEMEIEQNIR
jgi:hypothetical protein